MNQQQPSKNNPRLTSKPNIQQQVENSTLGSGMQAAIGDDNIQIQGDSNIINFNKTEILQISVDEIKTRKFIETSPYKGLKRFEKEDKDLFFGRDQFLTSLVNELEQTNLVLLLGASGSGKSSIVRAGLVPWLLQKYGTQLVNLIFTPDQDPFESLYASLLSKSTQSQVQIVREAKVETFTQVVTKLKQADDYWFILIDQFEELFTTSQPEKRDRFIKSLVQLAKAKLQRVKIMATMRADFLDKLSPYPAFVKATDKHRPMIAEMQLDELRLAIEQPAAHHGVIFETGLVEEIIKDIQGQPGYLPLLQYTLNLLWETELQTGGINDRTLNITTYRELGGVRGALQKHIDKIYEVLTQKEKLATKKVFLKLVGIGGNSESITEWKPLRRRANNCEFNDQLERVMLVKLIDKNLLVSDYQALTQESTVEIAHETLLTSWITLNIWIQDNRNSIALRNRLNDDVARWQAKKTEDELWTGSKLEQVLELRNNLTFNQVLGGFSQTACQFIDASIRLRDRQLRRAKITAVIGLTLAVLASSTAMVALFLWQESQKQSILAVAQTAEARLLANNQLDAMVEAIKAQKKLNNLVIGKNDIVSDRVFGILQQVVYRTQNGFQERLRLRSRDIVFSPDGTFLATLPTLGDSSIVRLLDITGRQLAELRGHSGIVRSVVFSPDSKLIATASWDNTARLWDTTGKQLAELRGHSYGVTSVIFSPDGKLVATASNDKMARLWDTTGKQLAQLRGHSGYVNSIVFSPDSKLVATASDDQTARLWDTTGKQLAQLRGHSGKVNSAVFSPDGKLIATASNDKTARLWDTTGKQLAQLHGHSIASVVFSPDSKFVATALDDKTVRLWDTTGKQLTQLRGHNGIIYDVTFSPDSKLVATASDDKTVRLWDTTGKQLTELHGHSGLVYDVVFSSDGKLLATASDDNTARLWDSKSKQLAELHGHSGIVYDVAFSPDSKLVATASDDQTARLWDTTGKQLAQLRGHSDRVNSVVFSPDSKLVATVSNDKTARIWDITGKQLAQLRGHSGRVNSVVFSPDSKLVATASNDKTARIWDITGKQLAQLRGHSRIVNSVKFSLDGKFIATASNDKTARIWDTTGKQLTQLHGHSGRVNSVVFSPDSKLIATASDDKTARLWDTTGKPLTELRGHSNWVLGAVFSSDNKLVATASNDNTARLWDITGKQLAELRGHSGYVNAVEFSPDSKRVATASWDNTTRLWDTTGKQLAELRGRSDRLNRFNSVIFSPNGKLVATTFDGKAVQLWQVGGIDEMLIYSCEWVRAYLNNPDTNLGREDRHLCDATGNEK